MTYVFATRSPNLWPFTEEAIRIIPRLFKSGKLTCPLKLDLFFRGRSGLLSLLAPIAYIVNALKHIKRSSIKLQLRAKWFLEGNRSYRCAISALNLDWQGHKIHAVSRHKVLIDDVFKLYDTCLEEDVMGGIFF